MGTNTISEPAFLITELRYTLGQLHVQLGDLDPEMRAGAKCGDRTVEQILQDLLKAEGKYQAQYAQLLNRAVPEGKEEEQLLGQTAFERKRAQTVALLEEAGTAWPVELTDLVKQQVDEDRQSTTDIANCRKQLYEADQSKDLGEPLVPAEDNVPHALGEQTVYSEPLKPAPEDS